MATVTRTTTWSSGQALTAAALNSEFDNLLGALALVNADISAAAGIAESKITFSGSGHAHTGGTDGAAITKLVSYGFFAPGTQSIATNISWNPRVRATSTAVTISAYAYTAPVGSVLTVRVYNITQAAAVATLNIADGANSATATSMTTASMATGDILRMDITAIGSGTAGADVSVQIDGQE